QIDCRLGLQWVEIVEIGDVGKNWDGNLDPRVWLGSRGAVQSQSAFRRKQPGIRKERHKTECLPSSGARDGRHAVCEQRRVAAKLVDEKAANLCSIGRIDHAFGADETRNYAAAVDVAD